MNGRVLILRPEPGASATVERARKRGLEPIVAPLFVVAPREWRAPEGRFDAVLMTSANAARLGGAGLRAYAHLPAYAVGEATAAAARAAGFSEVMVAGPDVMASFNRLRADRRAQILHLAGEHRTDADPAGLTLTTRIVYAAEAVEPPPALDASGIALLHSVRAARRFGELVDMQRIGRARVRIAALSAAVAAAAGAGWRAVAAAERPTDDALLDLAARMCD